MKKRIAKKRIGNYHWHLFHNQNFCVPKIGEIYEDCDGFNHICSKIDCNRLYFRKGSIIVGVTYYREDNSYFCSCVEPVLCRARTTEDIKKYWALDKLPQEFINEQRKLGWWTKIDDRRLEFVKNCGNCCDERGLPTKEWLSIKG